jgi:hypothetical protein
MIHSAEAVQTEKFDSLTPPPAPVSNTSHRGFPLPAEYYSAPPGDRRPLFAPWAATGCGIAAVVLLIAVFAAGYFAAHGGATQLMTWFISSSRKDLTAMYAKDVTADQKAGFDREMAALQANLAAKRIRLEGLQPVLRDMRDAMLDNKVTSDELKKLIGDLQTANRGLKPK